MILNEQFEQFTTDHPESTATQQNLLPVPLIEPSDNSEAMIYLCGQSGRYITGITLPVDAGFHRQVGTSLAYRARARGVEMAGRQTDDPRRSRELWRSCRYERSLPYKFAT